jgi:hypothetical protein
MTNDHVIADETLEIAHAMFSQSKVWVAYNTVPYFLEKEDVCFFKTKDAAQKFCETNVSEYRRYKITFSRSIDELLKQISYGNNLEQHLIKIKNLSIMNEQNFEYLKDNIKYMGFGEKQHEVLEQLLREGKESFQMTFSSEVNKKPFEAILQFRRPDNSDMYFFNNYKASLERSNGEKMEQTFYLNKGKGVTAKEAFNLLDGRSVFKELTNKAGESYKAWIQLDPDSKDKNNNYEVKQYHENYGYDLKAAVGKFAFVEMDGGEKEKSLMQSLQKGNVQSVTIGVNGESQKMFIEANPQYKTVTLYNDKMQRLNQEQRLELSGKQAVKEVKEDIQQDVKKENKKSMSQKTDDDPGIVKKKNSRRKGMSM